MKKLDARTVGIDSGEVVLFSDFASGGDMWAGQGDREVRRRVTFSEPFRAPPAVSVGFALADLDSESNHRVHLFAENVSADGFDVVFRTWGDTRVARISASWIAFGGLADEDDWQL